MSLVIITKSPTVTIFSQEMYKRFARDLYKKTRGPHAVTASLVRGLDELHYDYKLNPKPEDIRTDDTVWINESIEALKWAITLKNKLIVGPNLVISPLDSDEIICRNNITTILQPSQWTKDLMVSIKPSLERKIAVWPSGVMIPPEEPIRCSEKNIDVLIFHKNTPTGHLLESINRSLKEKKLVSQTLQYGKFKQSDYFEKLKSTKMLLYISNSESQGLALQEAWARDVPTLVYNRGYFKYKNYTTFADEKISAPYLSDQTGLFFNKDNFEEVFSRFWNSLEKFTARKFTSENLSDKVCAQKFLHIISAY